MIALYCRNCGHPMMDGPIRVKAGIAKYWCANCHYTILEPTPPAIVSDREPE